MILGIEIGGTKLQLGVGDGKSSQLAELARADIQPADGAAGILRQIERIGKQLAESYPIERVGIGFGGPVDGGSGRVITSHQICGWDNFPLVDWCRDRLQMPAILGNDCDSATLAEARYGAGQGCRDVFYVTVGTGVGGGFARDGKLIGEGRPAASEIGHLRPGLKADRPSATVEALASGWGISAAARQRVAGQPARVAERQDVADLLKRCQGDGDLITARLVAEAAGQGNLLAQTVLEHACQVLGWAIAQVITLLAPEVVVVGGGVSLMGEQLFFAPVRKAVARYVFPPLADSYAIKPAALGESVVVHGAIQLAAQ